MERLLGTKEVSIDSKVMSLIISKITEIQAKGFGDVTVYVRNGHVYRVRAAAEDYFYEEDIPTCEK